MEDPSNIQFIQQAFFMGVKYGMVVGILLGFWLCFLWRRLAERIGW